MVGSRPAAVVGCFDSPHGHVMDRARRTIPLKAAEDGNLFNKVVEHKLANGLKVLLLREPRAPIITLQVWYRVGFQK